MLKTLPIKDLIVGNTLKNDIFSEQGLLLLKKGKIVTKTFLDRLSAIGVAFIIYDEEITHAKDLREYKFNEFKKNCLNARDRLDNSFNKIIEKNITEKELFSLVDNCMELTKMTTSTMELLEMLSLMKKFDDATFLHSINVGIIASILAKWCGKSEDDIYLLMSCGIFHDIGKLTVPPNILNKKDKLTDDEFTIIKKHTVYGYNILKDLDLDKRIKLCALEHHEKIDGKGYPMQITQDKIAEEAKIIAIADVYDAMTSNRAYRRSMGCLESVSYLQEVGYAMFDTNYLYTFLHNVVYGYLGHKVLLSNNVYAEIILINENDLAKPLVKTLDGNFIDLSKNRKLYITELIV